MSKGNGRWVTIGGKPGKDGKKHVGGSPVYIEGGRITKGHPSLTGRKIDALGEDANHGTHRQQLHRGKQYARAKWSKEARQEGIDPQHLNQLAAELLAHDKAFADEKTDILRDARKRLGEHGGGARSLHLHQGKDWVKGVDEVAEDLSTDYGRKITSDDLMAMLHEGNPERLSDEAAYRQAFDLLTEDTSRHRKPDAEVVPFQHDGSPVRYAAEPDAVPPERIEQLSIAWGRSVGEVQRILRLARAHEIDVEQARERYSAPWSATAINRVMEHGLPSRPVRPAVNRRLVRYGADRTEDVVARWKEERNRERERRVVALAHVLVTRFRVEPDSAIWIARYGIENGTDDADTALQSYRRQEAEKAAANASLLRPLKAEHPGDVPATVRPLTLEEMRQRIPRV